MSQINIMALRHSAFYSPLLMTMAGGFLKDEGIDSTYTVATPDNTVVDNINHGLCDLAQSAVAAGFSVLQQGKNSDIVHFAQINERDGFFIAAREQDKDFNWQKLKGKRVLVDHFFQPYAMLKYGLYKQGISFDDFEVIDAGGVDQIEKAFRAGEGDYVHLQGPMPQQFESDGMAYVVAAVGDLVGPVAFSSLCASRGWLETDQAQAFMRAYNKALAYVLNASADEISAREYEAGYFPGIDKQVLTDTIHAYKNLGCWQNSPLISKSAYENLLDVFLFNKQISERYDYDRLIVSPPS